MDWAFDDKIRKGFVSELDFALFVDIKIPSSNSI